MYERQSVLIIGIFPRDQKFQTQNKYFALRILSQSTNNFVFIYFFVNKYIFCLHYMPDKRRLVTSKVCFGSVKAGLLDHSYNQCALATLISYRALSKKILNSVFLHFVDAQKVNKSVLTWNNLRLTICSTERIESHKHLPRKYFSRQVAHFYTVDRCSESKQTKNVLTWNNLRSTSCSTMSENCVSQSASRASSSPRCRIPAIQRLLACSNSNLEYLFHKKKGSTLELHSRK